MSFQEVESPVKRFSIQSSNGEYIVNALYRLWAKLIDLENAANPDGKSDLEKSELEDIPDSTGSFVETEQPVSEAEQMTPHYADDDLDTVPVKLAKETQTSEPDSPLAIRESSPSNTAATAEAKDSGCELSPAGAESMKDEKPVVNTASENVHSTEHLRVCPNSHYHLNLSDVPFLIGQSSSASHSVIANVQNLIGVMKTHTKGLCRPQVKSQREHLSQVPKFTSHSFELDIQNMKNALQNLTRDLSELLKEQAALKLKLSSKKIDATSEIFQEYKSINRSMRSTASDILGMHNQFKKLSAARFRQVGDSQASDTLVRMNVQKVHSLDINVRAQVNRRVIRSVKHVKERLESGDAVWVPIS